MALSAKTIAAADAALNRLQDVPPDEIDEALARIRNNHSALYQAVQAAKKSGKTAEFDEGNPTIGALGKPGSMPDPNRF